MSFSIDQIAKETLSTETLNALHACRDGHPLNNPYQWRNAHFLAAQRPAYEINCAMTAWLKEKADKEAAA